MSVQHLVITLTTENVQLIKTVHCTKKQMLSMQGCGKILTLVGRTETDQLEAGP